MWPRPTYGTRRDAQLLGLVQVDLDLDRRLGGSAFDARVDNPVDGGHQLLHLRGFGSKDLGFLAVDADGNRGVQARQDVQPAAGHGIGARLQAPNLPHFLGGEGTTSAVIPGTWPTVSLIESTSPRNRHRRRSRPRCRWS